MIWDLHCHLSGVAGQTPGERIARLLDYADRMGVERLCFFMGMQWSTDPTPDDFRRENDEVLEAISGHPNRCYGFVYLNPKHEQESLDELERCIANGPMVGVKLWTAERCSEQSLDALVRRAGELKALIYQHTWLKVGGNLAGESTPTDIAILAARHPEVSLVCGHTGGDWERGIRAVRNSPNVSVGIGGSDPTAGMVEMAVRELGAERVIYGSDIGGRSFASQLGKVYGAEIRPTDRTQILGGNLKRLLTPIFRDKGYAL
ncbi:amidohydrolase family protein [Candidatus Laterigemmans baculatus]|uniref:amidohydrolase family protein n=1 Tax=Candidatus Laterigemmans baculatus TaxID=2770505 RepID=UPI0013D9431E|nr:amidohydrolase family protein [Candidatus Laterigemmans baculatus]